MKGKDSLVRPSEDKDQAAQAAQRADFAQLEHRICEAQGGADSDHPRVGNLLSVCRHAQLFGRDRPMATQSNPHVYMEMLETGTHTLQELAEVRYPEGASVAMGEQSQRLLSCCPQFHEACCLQGDAEACWLSMPNGLLREVASVLRTAVCGTARTVV